MHTTLNCIRCKVAVVGARRSTIDTELCTDTLYSTPVYIYIYINIFIILLNMPKVVSK